MNGEIKMSTWNSLIVSLICENGNTEKIYENNCKRYRTFGNHDTVLITCVEGEDSNTQLKNMLKTTNEYSDNIKAGESIHNLFAVCENSEDFWGNDTPYLFISAIQINFQNQDSFIEQFNSFKENLNELLIKDGYIPNKDFAIYNSLDCGDILLFLRTDTYTKGADTINQITTKSPQRHYSYSICTFDEKILAEKLSVEDEIIPKVVVCSVLADASNYGIWFEAFHKEYPNEFMCHNCSDCNKQSEDKKTCERMYDEYIHLARLGNEDICINIFNCKMKHFLDMMCSSNGVFSYKNSLVKSMFSRLRIQFDSSVKVVKSPNLAPVIENKSLVKKHSDIWKPIVRRFATAYVCKAVSEVFASIENLETKKFAFDVQDCLKNVFPLFVEKISSFNDGDVPFSLKNFNKSLIWFTTGILSISDSTLHADKLFINTPGFNAVPCDAPSKLLSYYTAYIQNLVNILNDTEKFDYRFLLCPDLYLGMEVVKLFNYDENDSQLLKVRIPIGSLFAPKNLLMELSHEVAHFVGSNIRRRDIRASTLTKIISYKFADRLLRPKEFEHSSKDVDIKKEYTVLSSLMSNENKSFDYMFEKHWQSIPEFIQSKLEIDFDCFETLYLNKVREKIKDNALSLLVNDSDGDLHNRIYDAILNDTIIEDKTNDIFLLSTLITRHISELLMNSYSKIIDDCCMLCSESFADMIMLKITNDPQTYIHRIYEAEKNMAIEFDGKITYPWNYMQFKINKYERILSVFMAFGYSFDDIECGDDEVFAEFIGVLRDYLDPKTEMYRFSSAMTIVENAQYLSVCLEELSDKTEEFNNLNMLYELTTAPSLNEFISEFRNINFEFRADVIKANDLI